MMFPNVTAQCVTPYMVFMLESELASFRIYDWCLLMKISFRNSIILRDFAYNISNGHSYIQTTYTVANSRACLVSLIHGIY